uniref:Uncharacterized protein n=1 Tax=Aureoumbra lagunensis TaxID=44058 RepID=A0A7S3JXI2_9STRA
MVNTRNTIYDKEVKADSSSETIGTAAPTSDHIDTPTRGPIRSFIGSIFSRFGRTPSDDDSNELDYRPPTNQDVQDLRDNLNFSTTTPTSQPPAATASTTQTLGPDRSASRSIKPIIYVKDQGDTPVNTEASSGLNPQATQYDPAYDLKYPPVSRSLPPPRSDQDLGLTLTPGPGLRPGQQRRPQASYRSVVVDSTVPQHETVDESHNVKALREQSHKIRAEAERVAAETKKKNEQKFREQQQRNSKQRKNQDLRQIIQDDTQPHESDVSSLSERSSSTSSSKKRRQRRQTLRANRTDNTNAQVSETDLDVKATAPDRTIAESVSSSQTRRDPSTQGRGRNSGRGTQGRGRGRNQSEVPLTDSKSVPKNSQQSKSQVLKPPVQPTPETKKSSSRRQYVPDEEKSAAQPSDRVLKATQLLAKKAADEDRRNAERAVISALERLEKIEQAKARELEATKAKEEKERKQRAKNDVKQAKKAIILAKQLLDTLDAQKASDSALAAERVREANAAARRRNERKAAEEAYKAAKLDEERRDSLLTAVDTRLKAQQAQLDQLIEAFKSFRPPATTPIQMGQQPTPGAQQVPSVAAQPEVITPTPPSNNNDDVKIPPMVSPTPVDLDHALNNPKLYHWEKTSSGLLRPTRMTEQDTAETKNPTPDSKPTPDASASTTSRDSP